MKLIVGLIVLVMALPSLAEDSETSDQAVLAFCSCLITSGDGTLIDNIHDRFLLPMKNPFGRSATGISAPLSKKALASCEVLELSEPSASCSGAVTQAILRANHQCGTEASYYGAQATGLIDYSSCLLDFETVK